MICFRSAMTSTSGPTSEGTPRSAGRSEAGHGEVTRPAEDRSSSIAGKAAAGPGRQPAERIPLRIVIALQFDNGGDADPFRQPLSRAAATTMSIRRRPSSLISPFFGAAELGARPPAGRPRWRVRESGLPPGAGFAAGLLFEANRFDRHALVDPLEHVDQVGEGGNRRPRSGPPSRLGPVGGAHRRADAHPSSPVS